MGAAVGGGFGCAFFLFFFMGMLGAAPEPSESAKRLRSRSPDWDGSGEIGRMEVTKGIVFLEPRKFVSDTRPGALRARRAAWRTSCAVTAFRHDLHRSHAEIKID